MFILPVIFHATHYRKLDVERFLLRNKQYVLIGIFCVMLAISGLGLALDSKLPGEIAYGLAPCLSSLFALNSSKPSTNPIESSSSTEHYDRMGASMRWCQILASASSIFFGFLLNIAVDPPSYFTFFDNVILFSSTLCSNCSNSYVHTTSYFSCYSLS